MNPRHPFACRCLDCRREWVPYLSDREIAPEEYARHLDLIKTRERLSNIRNTKEKDDGQN